MVFDAYSKPELVKRWLLGPPGWEMVVCAKPRSPPRRATIPKKPRDAVIKSGMERGVNASYDRLDALLSWPQD
jgi:hypothetical protein